MTTAVAAPTPTTVAMSEIRCPGDDCGKLLLRYAEGDTRAVLDLKCPRCKRPWTLEVRST